MQTASVIKDSIAILIALSSLTVPIFMNNSTEMVQSESFIDLDAVEIAAPVPEIDVRQKTSPKQQHDVVFTFNGLPDAISDVTATADYAVDNIECVPPHVGSGARLRPEHSLSLVLQRIDRNKYATTVYADAIEDEDYYRLGVCKWSLNWTTLRFHSATTAFVGAIAMDQMQAGKPLVLHYLVSDFQNKPDPETAVFGEENDIFTAEAGSRFTLTVFASEVSK
jgi:hypothetical protein